MEAAAALKAKAGKKGGRKTTGAGTGVAVSAIAIDVPDETAELLASQEEMAVKTDGKLARSLLEKMPFNSAFQVSSLKRRVGAAPSSL